MAAASGLLAATSGPAAAAGAPTSIKYYLHSDRAAGAGSCSPRSFFLSTHAADGSDGGTGCGAAAGLPLDEVFYEAGAPVTNTFATNDNDPSLPLTLDGTRDITGEIASQTWTAGVGTGAGQVTYDVDVQITDADGNTDDLGTATNTVTVVPPGSTFKVPFDLPASSFSSFDGTQVQQVSLTVTYRGANVNAQAERYNGSSYFILPLHPQMS
jgi:hypothetical protein